MDKRSTSLFLRLTAAAVVVAVVVAQLWPTRGPVVATVALVFYGALFLVALLEPDRLKAWSRRHPSLDASIIVPITFLFLCLFDIPLALCAAFAVVAGAVLVPVVLWRRRREARAGGEAVATSPG